MSLPVLLTLPHAGRALPPEVGPYCVLTPECVQRAADKEADEIFDPMMCEVRGFVAAKISRAIVDVNRSPEDRGDDGVFKPRTRRKRPVYDPMPPPELFESLLRTYYQPYHDQIRTLCGCRSRLGLDCHTRPIRQPGRGSRTGEPAVVSLCCDHRTGYVPWFRILFDCFRKTFDGLVCQDGPSHQGFTTKSHSAQMPWVKLTVSTRSTLTNNQKRERILAALVNWIHEMPNVWPGRRALGVAGEYRGV